MRGIKLIILMALVACSRSDKDSRFVVLPSEEAKSVFATDVTKGVWQASATEIAAAESHISQIANLRPETNPSVKVEHPERYYRQYVPVRFNGNRLLYLSAICDTELPKDWHSRLVSIADGGSCYWQAFYNPATGHHSHLLANGNG